MANEFKIKETLNPKVIRRNTSGGASSEMFMLSSDTKTAGAVNATGWQSTDSSNGTLFSVNSDGFTEMKVWWVSDSIDDDVPVVAVVVGQRPYVESSMKDATDSSIFDTHSQDLAWFSCPPVRQNNHPYHRPGNTTDEGDPSTYHDVFGIGVRDSALKVVLGHFYSGTTKIYGGPIVDVSGTTRVTCLTTRASDNDGYFVGQFIK
tara:strand:+ start:860 stop:1474 length:615 start_codon:yes stop_codon:yes gene_type:complete